jgi:hypothetical protein
MCYLTLADGTRTDPSLRYFADRLKPNDAVQVVRNPEGFK